VFLERRQFIAGELMQRISLQHLLRKVIVKRASHDALN